MVAFHWLEPAALRRRSALLWQELALPHRHRQILLQREIEQGLARHLHLVSLGDYFVTVNHERFFQRSLESISHVVLCGIDAIDGAHRNTRSRRDSDKPR